MLVTCEQYIADLIDEYEGFIAVTRYHRTLRERQDVIKHYINMIINAKEKIAELKRIANKVILTGGYMSKFTNLPDEEEEVLSNKVDAWYIIAAMTRDLQPYIKQFKSEQNVDLTLDYFGWDGEESFAIYMNGHFCYTFQFNTYEPAIRTIGFDDDPLPKENEHAVELILGPLVQELLQKYQATPVKDLANDDVIDNYFNQIATKRGYR